MNKMIKLSEEHYIIVDDSEIKEGDYYICVSSMHPKKCVKIDKGNGCEWVEDYLGNQDQLKFSKKITHSTQPLIDYPKNQSYNTLILSEVQELIDGYSIEKMAERWLSLNYGDVLCGYAMMDGYMKGFKAHKELVKDKLFTIENMRKAMIKCVVENWQNYSLLKTKDFIENYIQSLFQRTEWEVEFNEQGKIKLI